MISEKVRIYLKLGSKKLIYPQLQTCLLQQGVYNHSHPISILLQIIIGGGGLLLVNLFSLKSTTRGGGVGRLHLDWN